MLNCSVKAHKGNKNQTKRKPLKKPQAQTPLSSPLVKWPFIENVNKIQQVKNKQTPNPQQKKTHRKIKSLVTKYDLDR